MPSLAMDPIHVRVSSSVTSTYHTRPTYISRLAGIVTVQCTPSDGLLLAQRQKLYRLCQVPRFAGRVYAYAIESFVLFCDPRPSILGMDRESSLAPGTDSQALEVLMYFHRRKRESAAIRRTAATYFVY